MADRRPDTPADPLEADLIVLGQQLDWPAEPALLPAIHERLASQPAQRTGPAPWWSRRSRLVLPAAAAMIVVALILTISDSTRSTVADRLGLPGISISHEPTATVSPGHELEIGEPSSLEAARTQTNGTLVPPPVALLGEPASVFVLERAGTVQVSYVYLPSADLPEVSDTGVGLLISQFDGTTTDSFIQKQLGPGSSVEYTEVNGQRAFWLTGAPHVFAYERPDGNIDQETIRLAANVLIWEIDGKTLRIESSLDLSTATRLAEAMSAAR